MLDICWGSTAILGIMGQDPQASPVEPEDSMLASIQGGSWLCLLWYQARDDHECDAAH